MAEDSGPDGSRRPWLAAAGWYGLAVLLLGVIDRQATVTEDSLRYVITQQLADQERLDHLAERFELASYRQEELP